MLGDPQFVGLLGQRFQVHGLDGVVYNIIRDRGMVMNSLFVFLEGGQCPEVGPFNCWSHPGSYLGSVGLVTANATRLTIHSGSHSRGFDLVTVDDEEVQVGRQEERVGLKVKFESSHRLTVTAGNYELVIGNSDHFVNLLSVRVLEWNEVHHSHGLLGQTWQRPHTKGTQVQDIEGVVDDYAELDNDLLGQQFSTSFSSTQYDD